MHNLDSEKLNLTVNGEVSLKKYLTLLILEKLKIDINNPLSSEEYIQLIGYKEFNHLPLTIKIKNKKSLDNSKFPTEEGIYLVKGIWGNDFGEMDVYNHPIKGLSCYSEDFGSGGTEVDDETDCHVSVAFTGLEFLTKLGNLN